MSAWVIFQIVSHGSFSPADDSHIEDTLRQKEIEKRKQILFKILMLKWSPEVLKY